jgi:predicted DNA-binding transcriptional regulator YafY
MPNKFDAMLTILNKIHGNENVTVSSLIDDLGMKERTVLRYSRA